MLTIPNLVKNFTQRTKRSILCACESGTARGTVSIGLALHSPTTKVLAIDYQLKYIALVNENAQTNMVAERITSKQGSVLQPATGKYDVLISTLPSMSTSQNDRDSISEDSFIEISGGKLGNDLICKFVEEAPPLLKEDGEIWLTMFEFSGLDDQGIDHINLDLVLYNKIF